MRPSFQLLSLALFALAQSVFAAPVQPVRHSLAKRFNVADKFIGKELIEGVEHLVFGAGEKGVVKVPAKLFENAAAKEGSTVAKAAAKKSLLSLKNVAAAGAVVAGGAGAVSLYQTFAGGPAPPAPDQYAVGGDPSAAAYAPTTDPDAAYSATDPNAAYYATAPAPAGYQYSKRSDSAGIVPLD